MKYWRKFSDAVLEAGFIPNKLQDSYSSEFIIDKYIQIIRELGHFPTVADLIMKANNDSNFPSKNTMQKFGNIETIANKILEFAKTNELNDIINICEKIIINHKNTENEHIKDNNVVPGEVYLYKSGRYHKIGKSKDTVRRGKELRIQLPEDCVLVHSIITDDPSGVELYWHRRLENKRINGEWFNLNSSEIKAFKRWKRIF